MLALVIFASILLAVKATSKIDGSWAYCTGADDTECPDGKYANISTEIFNNGSTIPVNENFTIIGYGYVLEAITDPSYSLNVKDGILIDDTIRGDGCKENAFKFPLNDGAIYYLPLPCPLTKNEMTPVTLVAEVSDSAPHGTIVATMKIYDQPNEKGNCIMCTT
eukprot:123323_1